MKRNCIICGRKLDIKLSKENKIPRNFYYFGRMKLPMGKGRWKKVGETTLLKPIQEKTDILKWTGKKKEIEYWECGKCFRNEN
jgi:rRNA pseudouridine-1189 N-methylase Emg1 (Nep1/Mra1 family)